MYKSLTVAFALLVATPGFAQDAAEQEGDRIVVQAQPTAETRKALADCLARGCPADADAAASLALAQTQFVAGSYREARATIAAALARTRGQARDYPVPVSDLLRAGARAALHLGDLHGYRTATRDVLAVLEHGLEGADPRILVARVELADSAARSGNYTVARRQYARVSAQARRLGHPRVEGFALLRAAILDMQLADKEPARYRARAERAFDRIAASTLPDHKPYVDAARVMRARMAARGGNAAAVESVIAEYARRGGADRPVLLAFDPIRLDRATRALWSGDAAPAPESQWIDVAFWVTPDGRPSEIEVLRHSAGFAGSWDAPIVGAIRSRRYAPLDLPSDDPGVLRVERYTLTSFRESPGATALAPRPREPRIEVLDLSDTQPVEARVAPSAQ